MNEIETTRRKILYSRYKGMINRTTNPNNKDYKHYGGRGIKVCDEWLKNFEAFYDWAVSNGFASYLSIDRIDVNGNYEPSNCRWISRRAQANNTRKNIHVIYKNKDYTLGNLARHLGVKYYFLKSFLEKHQYNIEALNDL